MITTIAKPLQIETDDRGVTTIALARPEIHNAFDDQLIADLTKALKAAEQDEQTRVVLLTGRGKSFSAGADLNWMRSMVQASEQDNKEDSLRLAELMRTLNFLSKPTIARVNGSAFGGGVGLIACCDISIASKHAKIGLTEARLGLVPAVISPYVIAAIGERQSRRLFQTAEIINADEATQMGLLHRCVETEALDQEVNHQIQLILEAGPYAVTAAKKLVGAIANRTEDTQKQLDTATAALIARLRVSPEGQEGLNAFLDKRQPSWLKTNNRSD